jgi:hypothetical protein
VQTIGIVLKVDTAQSEEFEAGFRAAGRYLIPWSGQLV